MLRHVFSSVSKMQTDFLQVTDGVSHDCCYAVLRGKYSGVTVPYSSIDNRIIRSDGKHRDSSKKGMDPTKPIIATESIPIEGLRFKGEA